MERPGSHINVNLITIVVFETLYKSKPSDLHKYKGDFARQLEVEKARVNKRQPTDEDFVKGV